MNGRVSQESRGFTLIEVVIAVMVMAISVPPTLGLMESSASRRADAVNTTRATILASSVLEGVLADVASVDEELGMEALSDSNTYLSTPTTGFYARMEGLLSTYTSIGMSYTIEISAMVSSDGTISGDAGEDVFRMITVRVTYPSATGDDFVLPVSLMVTEL